MRRKKKEEPEIYHTPFGSTIIPPYPEIDLSPYTIETTRLGDSRKNFITTTYPGAAVTYTGSISDTRTIYYPSTHWKSDSIPRSYEEIEMRKLFGEKEELKVKIDSIKSSNPDEHIVACQNEDDLIPERILITLSAVKGKLMFDVAPIRIREIQCSMTPQVKANLVTANKKLRMYGKKTPIVPNFDEQGNRLPDTLEIGDDHGITIKIVDPEDYGEFYFELKAIEFYRAVYRTEREWTYDYDVDIPF